jgi:palmitoyltransferase
MGNDRLKMAFWFEMLFDNDLHNEPIQDQAPQLRVDVIYEEVRNWLKRNNTKAPIAEALLEKHSADVKLGDTAGPLPVDDLLTSPNTETNGNNIGVEPAIEARSLPIQTVPIWNEKATSKEEQDRLYGRVSHEIDVWWKRVRDANYEDWVVAMETVENAISKAQQSKDNAMTRYVPRRDDQDGGSDFLHKEHYNDLADGEGSNDVDNGSLAVEDAEEEAEDEEEDEGEEDEDDDDSYVEGPLRGLLTEIPNILDTKQIEALHMTVKACIVDAMGSGLTKAGENLQKTRCKMFLALDCGKNLLREMLVFIAVWEQAETQFIFQITAQIIESFHHNALLPYAWNSLKILKDIVSPAQTVLLRLINYMFRARKNTTIYTDNKDYQRDAKLIHFLYKYFRCHVVPDCIALIYAQAQIRNNKRNALDFPVDLWDMERAKDGLSQYLDFISVIADIPEMRPLLIEWETVYELIALLNTLEAGVARKPLVEPKKAAPEPTRNTASAGTDATISDDDLENESGARKTSTEQSYLSPSFSTAAQAPSSTRDPTLPALHDAPHKFPWSGIKVQILIILTSLVAPVSGGRGPGNPTVQKQIVKHGGIMALLNCCVYDGHNEYLKERATLCIKFVMDGCEEAQQFVRELSPLNKNPKQDQSPARTRTQSLVLPATPPQGSTGSAPTVSPSSSSTYATATTKSQADESREVSDTATAVQNLNVS